MKKYLMVSLVTLFCFMGLLQASEGKGLFAVPLAFYTTETTLGGGFATIYYYANTHKIPSYVQFSGVQTARNQSIIQCIPNIYILHDQYRLSGMLGFYLYPDRFYGINDGSKRSEELFTPQYGTLNIRFTKKLSAHTHVGLVYEGLQYKMIETAQGKLLRQGTTPGSEPGGGYSSALGFVALHDTRNDLYYPLNGTYMEGSFLASHPAVGSDTSFTRMAADARYFIPLGGAQVIATQLYVRSMNGTIPFMLLSQLGGKQYLRGYYEGRFRDKNLALFQTEYRRPLTERFNAVFFGGVGAVFPSWNSVEGYTVKPSGGAGLRYKISKENNISVRLDLSFGEDENGFYAFVGEAF